MKTTVFWLSTFLVFGITNGLIAHKEAAIRAGTSMLLELAPVDPRSLMQGDYMALAYAIERGDAAEAARDAARHGQLVVTLDANHVARFARIHQGEPLADDEHLLRYRRRGRRLLVGPNAFFFQEGHATHYTSAEYGELKVAPSGESVLVSLRNADFTEAGP